MNTYSDEGDKAGKEGLKERKRNIFCETGFFLGIFSFFFSGVILVPIAAVLFSIAGLMTFRNTRHRNKWKAYWGLFLGISLALVNFV